MYMPQTTCNGRISRLRSNLFPPVYDPCVGEISVARARIVTQVYQEQPGLPIEILRAKALERVLDEISIYILDGELVVGSLVSRPRAVEVFPEYGADWILEELDALSTREGDKFKLSKGDKEELRTICEWWRGRTVQNRIRTLLGEEEYWCLGRLVFHSYPGNCASNNCICPDYPKIMRLGLNGIMAEVEGKLNALELSDPLNIKKSVFYRAMLITLKAAIRYANRFAALARQMAAEEADPQRGREL